MCLYSYIRLSGCMCFWHTFVDYFLSIPPQVYRFSGPVFTDRWMSSSWLLISAQCPSYLTFHSLDMKTTRSSAMLQPWQLCLEHPRACPMEGGGVWEVPQAGVFSNPQLIPMHSQGWGPLPSFYTFCNLFKPLGLAPPQLKSELSRLLVLPH